MATTSADIASAAELERRRLANQAAKARASGESQAAEARATTEAQAEAAIAETEGQYRAARTQAQREAETRQAEIRQSRGQVEREAEAAKGKARQARAIEQRKVVLPFTKPRNLGTAAYIASVEATRKQAHKAGVDAHAAVKQVRDSYFREVDKARDKAVADIKKQKAGIVADIQTQLLDYNAELNKQLAQMNSGISTWEAQGNIAIQKAQTEYEAALKATLNRSGTDVFADMKASGLIPDNATYDSYDKATGQLNYTIPDPRTGEEIFASEQKAGNIPTNATYKSYDSTTGKITYTVPEGGTTSQETTQPTLAGQNSTNVVGAAAGTAAMATMVITMGGTVAAVPTPPTWVIGGAIAAVGAAIAIYANREVIGTWIREHLPGAKQPSSTSQTGQAADAVVTNNDGTAAYSIQQFSVIPTTKGQTTTSVPLGQAKPVDIKDYLPNIKPAEERLILEQERIAPAGIPMTKEQPVVMIRDRFDVPELNQKASNIAIAAAGVATARQDWNRAVQRAVKESPLTRGQWEVIERSLESAKTAKRTETWKVIEKALEGNKDKVSITESLKVAYQEYLRKKAILDAARKAYVKSLNPEPIKGKGSNDATAAAVGLWLAQDIIRSEINKSLAKGDSLETAMSKAHSKVTEMSQELGLTRQQIDSATAKVVYQIALSEMTQQAIQTQGLTATQVQTQTLPAMRTAAQPVLQAAVNTHTLTLPQVAEIARELDQAAEATAALTSRMKLPRLPSLRTEGKGKKYPKGTIVWRQGETGRGDEYKIIPPPYTMQKPISSKYPPRGMTKTKGTPQQTLTFIGGKVPFNNVSFDLGTSDGFIDVKHRKINFTGGGQKTNVGTRIESTTKGVALVHNPPQFSRSRNGRKLLVSHGVYADKKNTRITRRRRRGWKRIY